MNVKAVALHTIVVCCLTISYTVLTISNHDATVLLGALIGYLSGGGVQLASKLGNGAAP